MDPGSVFGANLASFFLQKSINIEENTDSKRHSKFASSWTPFNSIFHRFGMHVGPQVRAKLGLFRPQEALKIQPTSVQNHSWELKTSRINQLKEPEHNQPKPGVNQNTLLFTVFRSSLQIEKRGGGSRCSAARWI